MGLLTGVSLLLISRADSLWQLLVCYGLFLAVGTGGTYIVLLTAVSRWFDRRRGFALGITGSGAAAGTVVVIPFIAYLIAAFDWRTAMVVLAAGTAVIVMAVALLLRGSPVEMGTVVDGGEISSDSPQFESKFGNRAELTLLQALKTGKFWQIWTIWLLTSVCINLILAHIVPHAIDAGVSAVEAATILSLTGIFNIIFRVIAGRVSDTVGRRIPGVAGALLLGGAMLWLIWAQHLPGFYIFAVAFGMSWGALGVINNYLAIDSFGGPNLGIILGAIDVGFAMGAAIGPALGGLLFDVTGAYSAAFSVGAAAMLLTIGLIILTTRKIQLRVK